jgi:hypothetical protein
MSWPSHEIMDPKTISEIRMGHLSVQVATHSSGRGISCQQKYYNCTSLTNDLKYMFKTYQFTTLDNGMIINMFQ